MPQELRTSPDGEVLTVLLEAQKPTIQGVPPPMRLGALWAVPSKGGAPQKLGTGRDEQPRRLAAHRRLALGGLHRRVGPERSRSASSTCKTRRSSTPSGSGSRPRVSYFVPSDDGTQLAYIE